MILAAITNTNNFISIAMVATIATLGRGDNKDSEDNLDCHVLF